MSSVTSKFSTAKTGVLWDLDYCPIPVGHSPASICANITSALKNMGYSGTVSFSAYSLEKLNEEDFESASIKLFQPASGNAKRERMFKDVYMWGLRHRSVPTNLLVISQKILLDNDYIAALLLLKEKENNILLTLPQYPSELQKCVASSVWLWTSLSTGGSPLGIQSGSSQVVAPPTSSPSPIVAPPTSSPSPIVAPPTSSPSPVVAPPTSSPSPVVAPPTSSPSPVVAPPTSPRPKKKMKRTLLPHKKPKGTNSQD